MLRLMGMGIVNYLRAKFARKPAATPELVKIYDTPPALPPSLQQSLSYVDFSYSGDIESYVRALDVPRETIEQWISTGLLFPDEMKMAEKMVQIMRRQEKEGL